MLAIFHHDTKASIIATHPHTHTRAYIGINLYMHRLVNPYMHRLVNPYMHRLVNLYMHRLVNQKSPQEINPVGYRIGWLFNF